MPEFLKSIWSDPVWSKVISAGIVVLLATVGTWILNDQNTKWPIICMIIFGVEFISCFVWYWNTSSNNAPSTPSTASDQSSNKPTVTPTTLDNTIGFECAWSAPPSHYREDKTLFIVDFQAVPVTGINPNQQVAGPMSFRRSAEPFKASDHYSNVWYRCNITNYGTQPVRNLRAKFPVLFQEAEVTETGTKSGKIVASGHALTPSIDLGTGPAGSDYFYFANASVVYIQVAVPTTAVLQTLADDELRVVKLVPPSAGKGVFFLTPSTNPLHPPTPTPQTSPEKK